MVAALFSGFIISNYGRRFMLILGCAICFTSLTIMAVLGFFFEIKESPFYI